MFVGYNYNLSNVGHVAFLNKASGKCALGYYK